MVCTQFEIPSLYRSQDEDADNRTERTHGDVEGRKKYSHVDLIHMIGGMDAERGTVTAGGRGYYLMVSYLTFILAVQADRSIHQVQMFDKFQDVNSTESFKRGAKINADHI